MRFAVLSLALVMAAGLAAKPADAALMSRIATANNVHVRSGPSTAAKIIGHLSIGQRVEVIRHVGTWDEIARGPHAVAYVDHNFLATKYPIQKVGRHYTPGKYERIVDARKDRQYVWMDFSTHLYHPSKFGAGKHGGYVTVAQAVKYGGRPDPKFY